MVLGDETLRPHRQLGIPPTTVLSGLLCVAHKSTAGFLCKECHAWDQKGLWRSLPWTATPLPRSSAFGGTSEVCRAAGCTCAYVFGTCTRTREKMCIEGTKVLFQMPPGTSSLLCHHFPLQL